MGENGHEILRVGLGMQPGGHHSERWRKYPAGGGPTGVPLNHNQPNGQCFALHQHEYIQTKLAQTNNKKNGHISQR
eukprot:5191266-Lingulodinium_polyedra.AAC.1